MSNNLRAEAAGRVRAALAERMAREGVSEVAVDVLYASAPLPAG